MLNGLHLYLRYVAISVRSQMQYKASFLMLLFGHFVVTGVEFVTVWALFSRFGTLEGWTLPEVALFYAIMNIAYSLSVIAGRGFDSFADMVRGGDFDRLLLRPRSPALQLAGKELSLRRMGRLLQAVFVLLWSAATLEVAWTPARVALLLVTTASGTCLFYGLLILQAALAFWTTEGLEIANSVTYGGLQATQYPLAIYRTWMQRFFTYAVPLACAAYFPVLAILDHPDPLGSPVWFQWASPLLGVAFLLVALQVWNRVGIPHYTSTGN